MTDLLTDVRGRMGHLTLNRPRALNALSLPMIRGVHAALDSWRKDPQIAAVWVEGAGGKAFSAGGDLRAIAAHKNDLTFGEEIFRTEYTLNEKIANYPKPYIALMHGVTMGGGIGIAVYGSHRIVTEYCKFAMPECGIGLFPDIGASYFLRKAPGYAGLWMGLTGYVCDEADALYAGFATHYVPSASLAELKRHLPQVRNAEEVEDLLEKYSSRPDKQSALRMHQGWIDEHFKHGTLEEIVAKLGPGGLADFTRDAFAKNSPTSMALFFEAFRRAEGQSLEKVLETDFWLSQHCLRNHDFYEGIRAAVIDKDKAPRWNPPNIAALDAGRVGDYFHPIPGLNLKNSA